MKPVPVLYVHNSSLIGGGNKILLTLFDQLPGTEFRPVAILPGAGPMEEQLRRRNIKYVILDLQPALHRGQLTSLRMIVELAAQMLRARIRLVHVNDPRFYRWASVAASWLGVARVCHLHLLPPVSELAWAFKILPHAAIACSRDMGRQLVETLPNLPAHTPIAIPNAVDLDVLKPPTNLTLLRDRLGLDSRRLIVTIVGLVTERKGHRYFLEMAQQVASLYRNADFLVVGEDTEGHGNYRRAMEQYTRELGLETRVTFLGFRDDAPDWMAASDVVVLPSLWEGLPVSLMEAHACGTPVVATGVDGIPEIVADGVTGILVPPRDTAALTKAVVALLSDEQLRRQMGVAARARVERLFSARVYAHTVEQVYRRLLG